MDGALTTQREPQERLEAGRTPVFDKLRELTRGGYLPDAASPGPGTGILLRHDNAPDLILQPDGTIELPAVQTRSRRRFTAQRMSKLRTLAIIVLAAGLWFLSVAITASLLEGF